MIGKKIDSADMPNDRDRLMDKIRTAGGEDSSGASSRLSAAIMRILATARGATEGRRAITPADLQPPRRDARLDVQNDGQSPKEEEDPASNVEWSLRMMQ